MGQMLHQTSSCGSPSGTLRPSASPDDNPSPIETVESDGSYQYILAPRLTRATQVCYVYLFHHGFIALFALSMLLPLSLIAQRKTPIRTECNVREVNCGFIGNADAYGMGIRLGVYLQWISCILVTFAVPSDERFGITTMAVFSMSLLIAILVMTFSDACTYSIEIIIMLAMAITNQALVAMTNTGRKYEYQVVRKLLSTHPAMRRSASLHVHDSIRSMHGFIAGKTLLDALIATYFFWFFLRFAIGSEATFAATPCGTIIIILKTCGPHVVKIASGVLACVSLGFASFPSLIWISTKLFAWNISMRIYTYLSFIITLPLLLIGYIWPFAFLSGILSTLHHMKSSPEASEPVSQAFPLGDWKPQNILAGISCLSVTIVAIAGIEVSLQLNGVQDVYSVSSTGQLIPLTIGVLNLSPVLWGLLKIIGTSLAHDV